MKWFLLGVTVILVLRQLTSLVDRAPAAEGAAPASPARRRWWQLGDRDSLRLLLVIFGLELWAWFSTDPDFPLPDMFRPVVLGLIVIFLLSGWIPWSWVRSGLRGVVLVILAGALVLEMNARFRGLNPGPTERSDDVLLRYHYKANYTGWENNQVIKTNSLGLRDEEHAIPKPPNVFRIVVLSSSVGNDTDIPTDERFHQRLKKLLAGAVPDGRQVEVVNMSVDGYNALQQERILEKVGLRYQPDLVVEAFTIIAAFLQDNSNGRAGNSYFLFRFLPLIFRLLPHYSLCSAMKDVTYRDYSFGLVVQSSFERLKMQQQLHGFPVLVAVLPALLSFDDPECLYVYDKTAAAARDAGLEVTRTYEGFRGEQVDKYFKKSFDDFTHVNAAGHERFAQDIAQAIRRMLQPQPSAKPDGQGTTAGVAPR